MKIQKMEVKYTTSVSMQRTRTIEQENIIYNMPLKKNFQI